MENDFDNKDVDFEERKHKAIYIIVTAIIVVLASLLINNFQIMFRDSEFQNTTQIIILKHLKYIQKIVLFNKYFFTNQYTSTILYQIYKEVLQNK